VSKRYRAWHSRIVDRRFILGDEEREHFVVLMRKLEAFLGLRVVTYVVMSNHFHLLVEEPDRAELPALDRETLLQRLGYLYDRSAVDTVRDELDRAAARGDLQWEQQIIERYERRMGDISIFMKELKQRYESRSSAGGFATSSTAECLAAPPLSRMSLRTTASASV